MKSVLVVGAGRFGRKMIEKLNDLGYEVMAIDRDESRINDILPLVTDAQIGDATDEAFLRSLGVDNFDVCFVAIGSDFQSSLVTTVLLKDLGAKKVVARASMDIQRKLLLRNGADEVVYPEKQLAAWTAVRHTTDHVLDFVALDNEHAIYELSVPSDWFGKTVGELNIRKRYNLNILTLREADKTGVPVNSETFFTPGQTMFVLGQWKDIQKCFKI